MHIFIDESGSFLTLNDERPHVCCVAALVVPSSRVDAVFSEFSALRRTWPEGQREVKGSRLGEAEVAQSIELAVRHDALLKICAVDSGRHTDDQVAIARKNQADKLRAAVSVNHHPNLVRQIHEMAAKWEQLPNQLAIQLYSTVHVVGQVLHHAPTYFAQRIPAELGSFEWILDRKDINQTPYETLWKQMVCPFLQATSLEDPFARIEGFDYSHMDRFRVSLDRFPHPQAEIERSKESVRAKGRTADDGIDIVKLVRDNTSFEDSQAHPGLQLVDILGNAFTRAMNDRLRRDGWGNLGRLMIGLRDKLPVSFVEIAMPSESHPTVLTDRQIRIMNVIEGKTKSMLV
jgi:hypothetical protein